MMEILKFLLERKQLFRLFRFPIAAVIFVKIQLEMVSACCFCVSMLQSNNLAKSSSVLEVRWSMIERNSSNRVV